MSKLIKRGDRVHVEFSGVVESNYPLSRTKDCWDVQVRQPDGITTYVRHENVTLIEPAYETEAAYIDARGEVYQFFPAHYSDDQPEAVWNAFGTPHEVPFHTPERPLRKLVPEAAAA